MCLGESTTGAGEQNSYPYQLEEVLNKRHSGVRFSVINKGVIGVNSVYILAHLEDDLNRYNPDMVITMMGINDSGSHLPYEAATNSKIRLFLKTLRTYKLARLLWLHIVSKIKAIGIYRQKDLLTTNKLRERSTTQTDFAKKEERFKKAITSNPGDTNILKELGQIYKDQGKYSEAEGLLKKALEISPGDSDTYVRLGEVYKDQGKYSEAEGLFKKALALNPDNESAYVSLGWLRLSQVKYAETEESLKKTSELNSGSGQSYKNKDEYYNEAEELFKKALEINPRNESACVGLGWVYIGQAKSAEKETFFKKQLELNPKNKSAYIMLGWLQMQQGKYSEAEESFEKTLEIDFRNEEAYIKLGWLYMTEKRYAQAERLFKRLIELEPQNDRGYRDLVTLYEEMGRFNLAKDYANKADSLKLAYCNPITRNNYRRLKEILDQRGVKFICMQYPVRSVKPLKDLFKGEDGVIFVDNEKIFKDALKKSSYKDYFTDMIAGDFGHCTRTGNRIIAKNVADVILKECFHK
jgi:tetratricopeptide (TPR) repeat protein